METQNEILMENKPDDLSGIEAKFFEDVLVLLDKFNQNVQKLASHHGIKVTAKVAFKIHDEGEE